jgi:hypothetical protein
MEFVRVHGVVLESAAGPAPSLAAAIAGGPIHGSWWAHVRGREIFALTRAVRDSSDVLVCDDVRPLRTNGSKDYAGVNVGEVISLVALTALLAHTNRRALRSFAETQVRV